MKINLIAPALLVGLFSLSACSKAHTEISGGSEKAFIESVEDLQASLTPEQVEIFDLGMALMRLDGDGRRDMDGMSAEDVMEVEFEHLRKQRESRIEKKKKFEGYVEKFRNQGSEIPVNILQTIKETDQRISELDEKLELAGM